MLATSFFRTILFLALAPVCLYGAERPVPVLRLDSPSLTVAEKYVLAQMTTGKPADLRSQFPEETNHILRAAFLEALLTQSGTNVHRNGFAIQHAAVLDPLDLRNAEVHCETTLAECQFAATVNFSKSSFENGFSLAGSTFDRSANFSAMKIARLAVLDQASFAAEVNAAQMEIAGAFSARDARFNSPTAQVDFTSLKTGGDACFSNATFAGPVTFQSAHISENWRFDGSRFSSPSALINFEEVSAGATMSFVGCHFAGYVSFRDSKFAALDFSRAAWPTTHGDQPWLWLNGMTFARISAGSEKDSWQNLYDLVLRTARGSAYSPDVFARLDNYYLKLGYPRQASAFFRAQKKREREEVLSGAFWAWSFFSSNLSATAAARNARSSGASLSSASVASCSGPAAWSRKRPSTADANTARFGIAWMFTCRSSNSTMPRSGSRRRNTCYPTSGAASIPCWAGRSFRSPSPRGRGCSRIRLRYCSPVDPSNKVSRFGTCPFACSREHTR